MFTTCKAFVIQKSQFPELIFTDVFKICQFLEFNPTVVDDPPRNYDTPLGIM